MAAQQQAVSSCLRLSGHFAAVRTASASVLTNNVGWLAMDESRWKRAFQAGAGGGTRARQRKGAAGARGRRHR